MAEDKHRTLLDEFEEDTYESEKEIPEENGTEKREPKAAKQDYSKKKKAAQGKKQSVLDVIAPSSVDNGRRDYIVVDGIYHSYLYVAGYGYRTRNEAVRTFIICPL